MRPPPITSTSALSRAAGAATTWRAISLPCPLSRPPLSPTSTPARPSATTGLNSPVVDFEQTPRRRAYMAAGFQCPPPTSSSTTARQRAPQVLKHGPLRPLNPLDDHDGHAPPPGASSCRRHRWVRHCDCAATRDSRRRSHAQPTMRRDNVPGRRMQEWAMKVTQVCPSPPARPRALEHRPAARRKLARAAVTMVLFFRAHPR